MTQPSTRQTVIVAVALGLAWPFVVDGLIPGFALHLTPRIASTVLHSGIHFDHNSFATTMRVINGVALITVVGLIFGCPLGSFGKSLMLGGPLFVVTVLTASLLWQLVFGYGLAVFLSEWGAPEMWLTLGAVLGVADVVIRFRLNHRRLLAK